MQYSGTRLISCVFLDGEASIEYVNPNYNLEKLLHRR